MSANGQDVFSASQGYWQTAADWSAGEPTSTSDVFIGAGASGAASAESPASVVINSVAVNAASKLTIDNQGTFSATNGSVLNADDSQSLGIGNAGVIAVEDDATFAIGDAFVNSGKIEMGMASLGDSGNLSAIGTVRLSGGGSVELGYQSGAAATTADINGADLVNVDNTIVGAGAITVATLDNQAGGEIVANQQYVDDLVIDVAQFTNEGLVTVDVDALLDLGQDGQTHAMTNSGTIALGSSTGAASGDEQLLISGNFTISGAGSLQMLGAYGIIQSDGGGAATFDNASTILVTQQGLIGGDDDFTFLNSGVTTASGAKATLTIDTGANAIGDSGVLQAANGGTLTIDSNVNVGPTGATAVGEIVAEAGGTVRLAAAVSNATHPQSTAGGAVVEAGGVLDVISGGALSAPLTIDGSSGATTGGVVNIENGGALTGPVTFNGSGGVLNLIGLTTTTDLTASGGTITLSGASAVINGADDAISVLSGAGDSVTVNGVADVVSGSKTSFDFLANAQASLTGSDDAVVVGVQSALDVLGANNKIEAGHDTISLGGGTAAAADVVTGSTNSITVLANAYATLTGDDNAIVLDAGAQLTFSGAGDTITVASATSGGVANAVNGAGASITLLAQALADVNGNDDTVAAGAGATLDVVGAYMTVNGSDATVALSGANGFDDVVSGSGNSVTVAANAYATVNGDNDAIVLGGGAHLSLTGTNDTVQATDDLLFVGASTSGDMLMASVSRVVVGADASVGSQGNGDKLNIGQGATVSVSGTGERLIGAGFHASAANASAFWVGGTGPSGATDIVTASDGNVRIGGNSNVGVSGDDDTVAILAGANASLTGAGFTAHSGHNTQVTIGGNGETGVVDKISGADFSLTEAANSNVLVSTLGANVTIDDDAVLSVERDRNVITACDSDTIDIIWGHDDVVALGQNDLITNDGDTATFQVGGAVGTTTINNFGGWTQSVAELLNGVGGFASADDAYAALTSDGNGGLMLSLGADGRLDFAGASLATISAANFKIG